MYDKNQDTICAPATVPGAGAISIIRVSGPEALTFTDRLAQCRRGDIRDAGGYTLHFATIFNPEDARDGKGRDCLQEESDGKGRDCLPDARDGKGRDCLPEERDGKGRDCLPEERDGKGHRTPLDDVLVSVFRAPHSYTGEDMVEISCHASTYIVNGILQLLVAEGCRMAAPGEFTQRAFLHGKMDLAQSEAVADLISAGSRAAHKIAMHQLKGGFSKELSRMRDELLQLASLLELELDFSEEEVEFADRKRLNELTLNVVNQTTALIDSFKRGNAIKNGIPTVIAGAVNSGKSTLLNTLLGEDRAIVSSTPGTTRDTIEETLDIDGLEFRFIDTAGLRNTDDEIELKGIERTKSVLGSAQLVIIVSDCTSSTSDNASYFDEIADRIDISEQKCLILVNKCDLIEDESLNNFVIIANNFVNGIKSQFKNGSKALTLIENAKVLPISAKKGIGVKELNSTLSSTASSIAGESDETLVTNLRHLEALVNTRSALMRVLDGLNTTLPSDLIAQDLREALTHLGQITAGGTVTTPEILSNIFSHFCIGK